MGNYTLSDAARILSVSPARLRYWEQTDLVSSQRGEREVPAFDFRDLVSARAVIGLLEGGVPLRRIRRSVETLRAKLPEVQEPLSALRLWSGASGRIVVEHDDCLVEPDGQMLLDFRVSDPAPSEVVRLRSEDREAAMTAVDWFERGCAQDGEPATYAEATEAYERALALEPRFADAHCNLGAVLYNRGQRSEAQACFLRCLALAPDHLEAHFNLGNLLEEKGLEEEALSHYLAAYQADPLHPALQVNLALVYEKLGRVEDSREAWRSYLKTHSDGPWAEVARQRLRTD